MSIDQRTLPIKRGILPFKRAIVKVTHRHPATTHGYVPHSFVRQCRRYLYATYYIGVLVTRESGKGESSVDLLLGALVAIMALTINPRFCPTGEN